jgi:putative sterol carrier protein
MPMVEEYINEMIRKLNEKAASDPKFEHELKGIRKVVLVVVTDGDSFNFILENARVGPVSKGTVANPDIIITGATDTYNQLRSGELRPMKAYATRKLQVKGSLEDILRLRKFF